MDAAERLSDVKAAARTSAGLAWSTLSFPEAAVPNQGQTSAPSTRFPPRSVTYASMAK